MIFLLTILLSRVKQTTLIIHPPTVKQLDAAEYWSPVPLIFVHVFQYKGRHQNKKHTSIRALPELPKPPPLPTPQFGQLYRLYPADKNDVLRVWRKKILKKTYKYC